jgi:VanZ family protein
VVQTSGLCDKDFFHDLIYGSDQQPGASTQGLEATQNCRSVVMGVACRRRNSDQEPDDGDYHEQLNQCEGRRFVLLETHNYSFLGCVLPASLVSTRLLLVEFLVAVVIIALLMAILMPALKQRFSVQNRNPGKE